MRDERRDRATQSNGFIPNLFEELHIIVQLRIDELQLQLNDAVPHIKEVDITLVFVILGRFKQPFLFRFVGHGGKEGIAVMFEQRCLAFASEDMFIASIGRCNFLVELLLIQCQGFIGDVEICIWTTGITILSKDIKYMAIAEGDAMFVAHQMLIRAIPTFRWSPAHHIVASACLGIVSFIPQLLQ